MTKKLVKLVPVENVDLDIYDVDHPSPRGHMVFIEETDLMIFKDILENYYKMRKFLVEAYNNAAKKETNS